MTRKATYQFLQRAADSWDVYLIEKIDDPDPKISADVYQTVARVTLDYRLDRYYIERPIWGRGENSLTWHRMPKDYLTRKAAFKDVLHPPKRD